MGLTPGLPQFPDRQKPVQTGKNPPTEGTLDGVDLAFQELIIHPIEGRDDVQLVPHLMLEFLLPMEAIKLHIDPAAK